MNWGHDLEGFALFLFVLLQFGSDMCDAQGIHLKTAADNRCYKVN